jgi:hypothetical protein
MSNKKPSENPNIISPSQTNNNIPPNTDAFSFLELDNFLSQEITKKENNNKKNQKKKLSQEKKSENSEKKPKLRLKPNASLARAQTQDDLMYIENENLPEEIPETSKAKEEKKDININATLKEKSTKKINNEQKIDKRIVKINLDKKKQEEKLKIKKDENAEKNSNDIEKSTNIKSKICDIESIINDIKQKDPKAYVPIILPFEKNDQNKNLKEELNKDNNLFIFQFPRQIPIKDLNNQIKAKEEENTNEEPNYDENGFLISQEFKNSFQEIKDNTKIGKLIFMKSGKIKIKMGDIYFDINEGSLTKFAQYSAIVTGNDDNQAFILGQPLNKKLIVTPEFD